MTKSRNLRSAEWSASEAQLLRKLHSEGVSFAFIAMQLPGRTRNACIGFARRNGLRNDGSKILVDAKTKVVRQKLESTLTLTLTKLSVIENQDSEAAPGRGLTLMELTYNTCRWPMGDWNAVTTHFCGASTTDTYCAKHKIMSAQPARLR